MLSMVEWVQSTMTKQHLKTTFLLEPGIPGPIYGSGCHKLTMRRFSDLTDVTLIDEDTNSIPTNNTNRTIQDNVAMPVTNPGDQFENICKWSNGQY